MSPRLMIGPWCNAGGTRSTPSAAPLLPQQARERVVEVDGGAHCLHPVAQVEALVRRVGLGVGIGHAHQDAGRALEEIGERLHEADGAARADHGRLLAEARLEGAARGLEGRPLGSVVHHGVVPWIFAVTVTP
jgi:hypothetical protein